MKIALLGAGNIANIIAEHATDYEVVCIYDVDKGAAKSFSEKYNCKILSPNNFPKVDLVVEAASQKAVLSHAEEFIENGQNLMIMSVGAFVDLDFFEKLSKLAKDNAVKLILPSGAIAGLDGIRAAKIGKIESVTITTTKPPGGLGLELAESRVIFEGPAKEAVVKYPKNVNVAATLSLVGIGFEKTKVRIVADPAVDKNIHKIDVRGEFGTLSSKVENVPSPNNPKTSYLAAMAAVAAIRNFEKTVVIG